MSSINPINSPNFHEFAYKFELTSENFNIRLSEVENYSTLLAQKLNELIQATNNVYPASAISYSNTPTHTWITADNVQAAIDFLANKYGNYDLLYDDGDVHRNHREIDHSGIPGIADVEQAKYDELVGGGDTDLHRHDTMYYTKTELNNMGVSLENKRLVIVNSITGLNVDAANSYTQQHGLTYKPDIVFIKITVDNITRDVIPFMQSNNGQKIGFDLYYDDTNIYITTGDIIYRTFTNDYTSAVLDLFLGKFF